MTRKYPFSIKEGSVVVKIYRSKHKTTKSGYVYTVAYKSFAGIRKLPQTASEKKAETEARRIAVALAAGKIASAEFSSAERDELFAAKKMCGDQPLLSCLAEYNKAKELVGSNLFAAAKNWSDANGNSFTRKLFRDVVDEFVVAKKKLGYSPIENHGAIYALLKSDLGSFFVNDLTTIQLTTWLHKSQSPCTFNTRRKRLVAIFNWCRNVGYLPETIRTAATKTETADEVPKPIGIITPAEFGALLHQVSIDAKQSLPCLVFAGFCGLRSCELKNQDWSNVYLDRQLLNVTSGKKGTDSDRIVPLCDAAVRWLQLCENHTGLICEKQDLRNIRIVAKKIGVSIPKNGLRHSFVSYRVAQKQDCNQAALEAGHSLKIQKKHYKFPVPQKEGEAWFGIVPPDELEIQNVA